jgi:hypothetical protein
MSSGGRYGRKGEVGLMGEGGDRGKNSLLD